MQKFKSIIFFVFASFSLTGFAQPADFEPLKDKQAFIQSYKKACADINSYQADFVQVKTIAMMKKPLTSEGKMYMRKDNRVKIEYVSPYQYIFIMNGTKVTMKDGNKEANSVSMGNNKLYKQISEITLSGINGDIFNNKNFSTKIFESASAYMLEAIPLSKEMKEYYQKFELYFNKANYQVEKIVMTEVSDDVSVMTFKKIELNKTLNDAVFEVR
jgi:outer membrane lipoprotein-sorting protein